YQGAYLVCDATKYAQVLAQVGSRIELIGQIHSVRTGWGANKKPYVFVNFSDWRGQAVKLAIWSDGMKAIGSNVPDKSWVGRWLSVTGLVDPPYKGQAKAVSYTHLSLTITASGQIQQLPEQEAQFRLRSFGLSPVVNSTPSRNADVLSSMGRGRVASVTPIQTAPPNVPPPKSSNQQLLEKMQAQASQAARQTTSAPQASTQWQSSPAPRPVSTPKRSSGIDWVGWLFIIIMGLGLLRACVK
ncbi:protein kinase family protein, partial [Pseudomonas helleri]